MESGTGKPTGVMLRAVGDRERGRVRRGIGKHASTRVLQVQMYTARGDRVQHYWLVKSERRR